MLLFGQFFVQDDEHINHLRRSAELVGVPVFSLKVVFKPEFQCEVNLLLELSVAFKRGFLMPGKRIDYERTGRTVIDEFRSGKLGRITLETVPSEGEPEND